jgi:hypothetical protein
MHAAGCTPSLAPARASRALRSGCARRSAPRAAVRTFAQESMSEAYARIRAQRAKTKARYEREEKLEKAGALGKLFGGVISGALSRPLEQRRPSPEAHKWLRTAVPAGAARFGAVPAAPRRDRTHLRVPCGWFSAPRAPRAAPLAAPPHLSSGMRRTALTAR